MRIYSPTRTETWDQCPLKAHLQNVEGWERIQADKPLLGKLAGRAFADGIAVIHQVMANGGDPSQLVYIDKATDVARYTFTCDITRHAQAGVVFEEPTVAKITIDFVKAFTKYASAATALWAGWQIQDVERELPNHGRCRIDVGGITPDGVLATADVKYKRYLGERYRSSTIEEYLQSWQFKHYTWAYGEYKQQPCTRVYLCLVALEPRFEATLHPYEIHPDAMRMWYQSAVQKWKDMEQEKGGERALTMAAVHKTQYGMCPFYRACFDFHLDEGLMQHEYVRVPREAR